MNNCWMCECVFGPQETDGVGLLLTFNGYTVDFRLKQFRKVPVDALPELIDFDSPEGIQLCAAMHEAAVQQLNMQFGKEMLVSI